MRGHEARPLGVVVCNGRPFACVGSQGVSHSHDVTFFQSCCELLRVAIVLTQGLNAASRFHDKYPSEIYWLL